MTKYSVLPRGDMQALRQAGQTETHPEECPCRRCRRSRAARARRVKPRYGQNPVPLQEEGDQR